MNKKAQIQSRYHRQMILPEIGEAGQEKLSKAKVFVIGAGGLGSPVLMYLAAAGIGTIGIIEYDKVDISNLHRQIMYNTTDVGKDKIDLTVNKLKAANPEINIIPHKGKLTKENILDIMKDYDIVVDGSDNFPTRFMVSDATVILKKPLVFGAVYQFMGQASIFNYKDGPTYRCVFPEQPKSGEMPSCSTGGVIGPLPGIIGSIQANETIKIILDIGETLSGKFLQLNSLDFKIDMIEVAADEENKKITELGDYEVTCETQIKNISPHELIHKKTDSKIKIYEIRSQQQFNAFNIGGERIDAEELLSIANSLDKYEKVLLVCQRGIESLSVAERLQNKTNLGNIYNLQGGMEAYLNEIQNQK